MKFNKINIIAFSRDYPSGMAGTKRVQHLLYYLHSQNVNINVISFRGKHKQPALKGTDNGIPYINIGTGVEFKLLHLHRLIGYFIKGLFLISKFKKGKSENIIYCYGPVNIENFPFIFWAKIIGFKLVFDIDEDFLFFADHLKLISRFKFWTVRKMDSLTSKWATGIVVISKRLMNKYSQRHLSHLVMIPVTAKQNFNPLKKGFNNPLQVVYAGSFGDKDGVNDIITGFNSFNEKYKNARLILTGKSDEQAKYQEKFKDNPNLVFKGRVSDDEFYDILRNADVMCMCRTNSDFANAGFPFKLGEYLATGNPVISTRASDVEYYLTGEDAYLIDSESPKQISDALFHIISKPEEAHIIGLNGKKKCEQYFSPEANGRILYDMLTRIASE